MRRMLFVLLVVGVCVGADCQGTSPAPLPISTVLPPGVFTGTSTCDLRKTAPGGEQTTEEITQAIAFEIDSQGIPVVQGEQIRVGRTVGLEGVQVTYTRIQATDDGIVVHSNVSGAVNGVSFSGLAIATMNAVTSGEIEYIFTQTWNDAQGFSYNTSCNVLLSP